MASHLGGAGAICLHPADGAPHGLPLERRPAAYATTQRNPM